MKNKKNKKIINIKKGEENMNNGIRVIGKKEMDRVNELWSEVEELRFMIRVLKNGYVERVGEARGAGCSEAMIKNIKKETQAEITECCEKRNAVIAEIERIASNEEV